MIDRFLLSRLESLSALLQVFQIFRGRSSLACFPPCCQQPLTRPLTTRRSQDRRDCVCRVCLPPLVTSTTDSPTLASRLVGQCFYSDAGASGGKTLISRLNLYPSATCRALWACPLWDLWSVSASALQTRKPSPNTTGQRRYLRPNVGAVIVQHHTPGRSYRRHKFICHD